MINFITRKTKIFMKYKNRMKRVLSIAALFLLCMVQWKGAEATGMSGSYTINPSGSGSTNFTTFTNAVDTLTKYGVSGPVVFNVANGTYNEQISMSYISGSSVTNNITFQSASKDSSKVILTYPSLAASYTLNNYVIQFDSASFIKIKQITIQRTGILPNGLVINFNNNTTYDSIMDSRLLGIKNTIWTNASIINSLSIDANADNGVYIGNNILRYGYCSINTNMNAALANSRGMTINHNSMDSFYYAGIYLGGATYTISDNLIYANYTSSSNQYGIYIIEGQSFSIIDNKLINCNMQLFYSQGSKKRMNIVANNFVGNSDGISIISCSFILITYNNVLSHTKYIAATFSGSNSDSEAIVENNNFVNNDGGGVFYAFNYTTYPTYSNYNNFYSTGTNSFAVSKSSYSFSNYKSIIGMDSNSTFINPNYINDSTDLHATNDSLKGKGIYVLGITTDIDGNTRPNPPAIGANEITKSKSVAAKFYITSDTNCVYSSISFTDSSKSDSCGTINKWLWNFGDGDTSSAQNPAHTYSTAGVFTVKLIASSSGGCTDSFTKNILIDSTCVWPGDANNNKWVEITDVLNIGIAFNDSGPSRGVMNNIWTGQHCDNWGKRFMTGADYKHADCNGDGVVDSSDLMAININWGDTHKKTGSAAIGNPSDPPFYLKFAKDSFGAGDTVSAQMVLGDTAKSLSNVYGFAFSYSYDPKQVQNSTLQANFTKSWFGTPGKDLLTYVHLDTINGVLSAAITRTDHINISGQGAVGTVGFVMQDNIAGKRFIYKPIIFTPVLAKLISYNETNIPVYLGIDSFIGSMVTGIAPVNNSITGINAYPNPAHSAINIDAGSHTINSVTVYDGMGREVYTRDEIREKQFTIPVSALSQGIYIIRMNVGDGVWMGRFVKE